MGEGGDNQETTRRERCENAKRDDQTTTRIKMS
jgi:hypothetical protein